MGLNTKWIEGRPDDAARKVARRALKRYLARMSEYLELALCDSPSETENVHQLRVFSRRAGAVMEIFAAWLPKRRGEWMQRKVRKVRKAAGEARDFDVLWTRWAEYMRHSPSSHAALLLEQIKQRRKAAQGPIEAMHRELARKRFGRRTKQLLKRMRRRDANDPCDDRFGCVARVALANVVRSYLEAAGAQLDDAAAMHAFRIQSKHVRYAMEVFAGAFDEDFRQDLYPLVANLQDRLGAINDHVTAQTYFAAWHAQADSCAVRAALETAIDIEQKAFESGRREFLDWWTPSRREDLCRRFSRYADRGPAEQPAPATPFAEPCGNR
jgi:CHAD domain-containing protein